MSEYGGSPMDPTNWLPAPPKPEWDSPDHRCRSDVYCPHAHWNANRIDGIMTRRFAPRNLDEYDAQQEIPETYLLPKLKHTEAVHVDDGPKRKRRRIDRNSTGI